MYKNVTNVLLFELMNLKKKIDIKICLKKRVNFTMAKRGFTYSKDRIRFLSLIKIIYIYDLNVCKVNFSFALPLFSISTAIFTKT